MAKWTCPDCGSELNKKSQSHFTTQKHLAATGASAPSRAAPSIEEDQTWHIPGVAYGAPRLGGEIGRLRAKAATDPTNRNEALLDAYVKIQWVKDAAGKKVKKEGQAGTRVERDALRQNLWNSRQAGKW